MKLSAFLHNLAHQMAVGNKARYTILGVLTVAVCCKLTYDYAERQYRKLGQWRVREMERLLLELAPEAVLPPPKSRKPAEQEDKKAK
jgi:hypothetical protein